MPDSGNDKRGSRKAVASRERAARAERRARRLERQAARAKRFAERQAGDDFGHAVRGAVDAVRKNLSEAGERVSEDVRGLPYQVDIRPRRKRSRRRRELTPEEQALQEARRTAERKIKFVQHLVSYTFVIEPDRLTR